MILKRRASLGNVQLDEANEAIVIRGVEPGKTDRKIGTAMRMNGFGVRITNRNHSMIEAKVTFAINIKNTDLAARRGAFDAAMAWAMQKGWLKLSENPGRRLYVEEVVLPEAGDLWDYTAEYKIGMQAYGVPFWQDSTATEDDDGGLTVPGLITTVCNASIETDGNSTIDSLTVTTGDSTMQFANLGLEAGETLRIGHGNTGLLWIRIYNNNNIDRSVMNKRTGGADDLYVEPGLISVSASAGTASFSCYGRYES